MKGIEIMSKKISEQQAKIELEKGYSSAEATLKDKNKLDEFLKQLEEKLKVIPKVGNKLSHVAVFAQMVKDYSKWHHFIIICKLVA